MHNSEQPLIQNIKDKLKRIKRFNNYFFWVKTIDEEPWDYYIKWWKDKLNYKLIESFRKFDFVNFPFFCCKSSLDISCKSLTGFWVSCMLEIIITYRKFWIRFLHNNTNVATSKNRTFGWVAGYCKLS